MVLPQFSDRYLKLFTGRFERIQIICDENCFFPPNLPDSRNIEYAGIVTLVSISSSKLQ